MPDQRSPSDGDLIARLSALVDEKGAAGRGRRSQLALWLTAHREQFAKLLAEKDPRWDVLAEGFAEAGIRDGRGNAPTGTRLRKTWWLVNRPGDPSRRQKPPPPKTESPSFRPSGPPKSDPGDPSANPFGFKPGKPKVNE